MSEVKQPTEAPLNPHISAIQELASNAIDVYAGHPDAVKDQVLGKAFRFTFRPYFDRDDKMFLFMPEGAFEQISEEQFIELETPAPREIAYSLRSAPAAPEGTRQEWRVDVYSDATYEAYFLDAKTGQRTESEEPVEIALELLGDYFENHE